MRHRLPFVVSLLAVCQGAANAEPLRDPMLPPAEARATLSLGSTPVSATAATATPVLRQILIVDGRRYAVEGTRLRAVGDRFGGARIERIGDDAIWLRDGAQLQRVPLFAGITRRAVPDGAPSASAAPATPASVLARAPRIGPNPTP